MECRSVSSASPMNACTTLSTSAVILKAGEVILRYLCNTPGFGVSERFEVTMTLFSHEMSSSPGDEGLKTFFLFLITFSRVLYLFLAVLTADVLHATNRSYHKTAF